MASILKDSDTLTAPEKAARSRSATESGGKAQPIALEIPITVSGVRTIEGSDKREPFSESTKTVMVHGSGAVIRLTSAMAPGQLLFLTNDRKKEVVCQVVKSKNYRNVSGYVELEFTEPAVGFWGMRFPGDRIGGGPQAAPTETSTTVAGKGAAAPVPARPVPKIEQPAASMAPSASVNAAKPSAPPAPSVVKLAPPATAGSPIVPPARDSAALPVASKAKADVSVRATPVPIATTLGADTPLIEPWLKKREPAPRVPAAPSNVAPPAPPAKPAEPESSLTPIRSFAIERPSEKPASLFAPAQAPANLSSVDLSSITPFFEVKPVASDAPPKPLVAGDPETEELKQQTARLQDELATMQFSETTSISLVKADEEKPETRKRVAAPEAEIPSFPLTEQSIETLKTELVHENAVRLVENPEPTKEAPVLPELSKLDEPVRVETPAVIPALESLEHQEMKIPAWLEPLARNSSAPSSTEEPVLREKSKRRAEQPPLQELVAPLAAPKEEKRPAEARVPQFGSALPFEDSRSSRQSPPKRSSKGMMVGGIAAGILALAGGGWWYMNQRPAGAHGVAALEAPAAQESTTSPMKESVLGTTSPHQTEATASEVKPADVSTNAASNPASNVSSPAPANSSASSTRGMQGNSNGLNGGNLVTKADATEPEIAHVVEKKPALGVVHLAAPKISQKRTVQAGAAPDAGILNDDQPAEDANSLGGLAVTSNQPAAPATATGPVAVGGDVKQAKLISSVPPAYPALAKAEHVSGAVTIDALIEANGRVTTMKVISGPTLLQEAAKDALKQWKYQPAMLDGKAVSMHLTVTIQFRLQQ